MQSLMAQMPEHQVPTFSITIKEDQVMKTRAPSLHRLLISFLRTAPGVELEQFHPEALGLYDIGVYRDGKAVVETEALKELKAYRKVDAYPIIEKPKVLKTGEVWTTAIDVGDFYDMSSPGVYRITVSRKAFPLTLPDGASVYSNTVTLVVPSNDTHLEANGRPEPTFELNLSSLDVESGGLMTVRVDRKNVSGVVIREAKCWPWMGLYSFSVFRNGVALDEILSGERITRNRAVTGCPGNETLNVIEPNDVDSDYVPLGDFYDLREPGSYLVYATRESFPWNPAKSVLVRSNAFSFEVTGSTTERF